jgi:hypothetical protein
VFSIRGIQHIIKLLSPSRGKRGWDVTDLVDEVYNYDEKQSGKYLFDELSGSVGSGD